MTREACIFINMTDSDRDHIISLTADYALGLLADGERRRVDAHVRQCAACRAALRREMSIEPLARGAILQAARPAPERLAAVRAAVIPRPAPRALPPYRRLAPITVVTVLMGLGLLLGSGRLPFTPAVYADNTPTLTVTHTQTPTATLAAARLEPAQSPPAPAQAAAPAPQPAATSAAPQTPETTPITVTAAP